MKKLIKIPCLLILLLLIITESNSQIYVSTKGSDNNDGTKEKPLASVAKAVRKARELRRLEDPSIKGGIHIIVADGTYQLDEPLFIRPEDSGTDESPTIIEGVAGSKPIVSGGTEIKEWRKAGNVPGLPASAQGKVWVADAPAEAGRLMEFRQLWVNDNKAIRAKDTKGESMNRILSWDKKNEQCWIPKPAGFKNADVAGIEMFIHQWWAIAILRVKKVEDFGDSLRLSFYQPESRIQSEHPWPAPWISKETGNSAFYLTNALQFVDEPGEWFLDMQNRKVYYYPRSGENMLSAKVIAPKLETLVKVEGTIDHPVSNFYFKNISFEHSSWLRPSKEGLVPHQAGMPMLEAYKLKQPGTPDKKTLENQAWVGRPAAAVTASFAQHIGFSDCSFKHMASTGLDYHKGVQYDSIVGNLFQDIGGTAILAGVFSDEATEVHLSYNPKDERVLCSDVFISNNLIDNATNEDWGCVGIGAGYVRNTTIAHNEVRNVSYSGISLGWGWTKTTNAMQNNNVFANKITHYAKHMYDVAGIYTLSAQPGTTISNNYIDSIYKAPYAHLPHHWFYLYTDEGSSYMTIKSNWTPSQKYLQNANGPGNTWEHNGPMVSDTVKANAGLLGAYQYLRTKKIQANKNYKFNKELPVVIEVIADNSVDVTKLKTLLTENNVHDDALYQWQNHYVIFDEVQDVSVLAGKIKKAFPTAEVKTYSEPFYDFNRTYCSDKIEAKQWDNIILTANLVADKKLQQEYIDYHATQFEKWPEIAKGFCNADFQQLLVYRNGRQLMLVISIPKGESLDKLNPRTTENNPRVNQWNTLMKKYQEGIEGTKKGETWVFLKRVNGE